MQNLQQLYKNALDNGDLDSAEQALRATLAKVPHDNNVRLHLANFLVQYRSGEGAAELFTENNPDTLFNRAYYLSKAHNANDAIKIYQQAIAGGLRDAHEAYCNIGSLYREQHNQDDLAEIAFKKSLELLPSYSAAIINLANLFEDRGFKDQAEQLLQQINEQDPYYPQALCRLAGLGFNETINRELHQQLQQRNLDPDTRCDILYAIGHQWDKAGQYEQAKKAFDAANQLNAQLIPAFSKDDWQAKFDNVIAGNIDLPTSDQSSAPEVFYICGMFRSGSTLLEQMLASHPHIAAGGELSFFPKLAAGRITDLNDGLVEYHRQLEDAMADKHILSDKRNDNLWHVDLIKAIYPKAKIIFTDRNIEDCAVSIYQQRLGSMMNYACNYEHIYFYEDLCRQLKQHWQEKYPEDVISVQYEKLVKEPKAILSDVLKHLGQQWDDQCLDFQHLHNTVKTASVWQVRQPLNDRSVGRAAKYL